MKRFLLFLLCQGSLDGFSQELPRSDFTLEVKPGMIIDDVIKKDTIVTITDTLASHLLISHRPPSFGHSIEGYCIVVNGSCTGRHLVYRKKKFVEIKPPYDVWRCIRKEGL
jgi:hypothetical protein